MVQYENLCDGASDLGKKKKKKKKNARVPRDETNYEYAKSSKLGKDT